MPLFFWGHTQSTSKVIKGFLKVGVPMAHMAPCRKSRWIGHDVYGSPGNTHETKCSDMNGKSNDKATVARFQHLGVKVLQNSWGLKALSIFLFFCYTCLRHTHLVPWFLPCVFHWYCAWSFGKWQESKRKKKLEWDERTPQARVESWTSFPFLGGRGNSLAMSRAQWHEMIFVYL